MRSYNRAFKRKYRNHIIMIHNKYFCVITFLSLLTTFTLSGQLYKNDFADCDYVAVYESEGQFMFKNKEVLILDASTQLFFLQHGVDNESYFPGLLIGIWEKVRDTLRLRPLSLMFVGLDDYSVTLDSTPTQMVESFARDLNIPLTYHRDYSTYLIKKNTLTQYGPPPTYLCGWGTPYPDKEEGLTFYLTSGKAPWTQPKLAQVSPLKNFSGNFGAII